MPREWSDAYASLQLAVRKLNLAYPDFTQQKGLEEYVRFRIIDDRLSRGLLYKIDGEVPEGIKDAIRTEILKQAKKLRIEVITIS
jgi:hypothetical protein